jgi:hypothetical protein
MTSYLNSHIPLYLLFAFMFTPRQSIRVLRSLPRSLGKLTAHILLTAYVPTAIFLTIIMGAAVAGLVTPSWYAILLLLALPPVLAASEMRFGGPGCVLICLSAIFLSSRLIEQTPSMLAVGAAIIAMGGSLWLRRQLLVGREGSFRR